MRKVLLLFLVVIAVISARGQDTTHVRFEARCGFGWSTYTVFPALPLKRASFNSIDIRALFGKGAFRFIAGADYNSVRVKHYPALLGYNDSTYIEGTWKRSFNFYTVNVGLSIRPIKKIGLEVSQTFGISIIHKIHDHYNYPGREVDFIASDKDLKLISCSSIDYFFPIKRFEMGAGITILKRFDNHTNIPLFNYGGGITFRYNI